MPRGKWTNHKGRNRRFTNPEELEEQRRREEEEKRLRKQRGDSSSDEEAEASKVVEKAKSSESDGSDSGSESEDDEDKKGKGVEKLIEVSNPNRIQKKTKKLSELNQLVETDGPKPELSRRQREELEKYEAQLRYQKMHAEGKTDEARADLARLAIIKQQREEAAKKREADKLQKEAAAKQKAAARKT